MIRIRLVTSCMFSGVLSVQLRHDVQICADCYLNGTWSWSMLDGWDVGLGLPRTPLCGAGARPLQNKGGAKGRGRDNCVPQHQSQELRTGFGPRGSSPPPHNHLHRTSFVNDSFPLNSNFEPVFDLLRHRLGSLGNGDVGWRSVPGPVRNRCRRSIDWNSTPHRIALTAVRIWSIQLCTVVYDPGFLGLTY